MDALVRFWSAFHLCSVAPVQRSTSMEDHCGQDADGEFRPRHRPPLSTIVNFLEYGRDESPLYTVQVWFGLVLPEPLLEQGVTRTYAFRAPGLVRQYRIPDRVV